MAVAVKEPVFCPAQLIPVCVKPAVGPFVLLTVTVCLFVHPLVSVIVTVYVPDVMLLIAAVVCEGVVLQL